MLVTPVAMALSLLASGASAALSITNPVADSVFHGASTADPWTFKIAWAESDNSTTPLSSSFGSSLVQLMVGSTYEQYVIANLTTLDPATTTKYQASVDASAGGNSTDYFIRIRSTVDDSLEAFSHKFQLASMVGEFTAEEASAISVGLESATTAVASSTATTAGTSTKTSSSKAKAVATTVTSASATSSSATASKADKAAETTLPAASGAQRVGLSAAAALAVAGVLTLLA